MVALRCARRNGTFEDYSRICQLSGQRATEVREVVGRNRYFHKPPKGDAAWAAGQSSPKPSMQEEQQGS